MRVRITITVSEGYADESVRVELGEEQPGAGFGSHEEVAALNDAIRGLAHEAAARAYAQTFKLRELAEHAQSLAAPDA